MTIFMQHTTKTSGFFYEGTLVFSHPSKYQQIQIVDTPQFGRCLLLDGKMMLSTEEEHQYHELLVMPACLSLEVYNNALVVGGGDLFTANMLTQFPFKQIDVVELDEDVVRTCKTFFGNQLTKVDDPRINLLYQDATTYSANKKYSFIALDLTDPDEDVDLSLQLYSKQAVAKFKDMLYDDGIMVVQVACPLTCEKQFKAAVNVLSSQFEHVAVYGKYIPMYGCYQFFAAASDWYNLNDASSFTMRYNEDKYDINNKMFSTQYFQQLVSSSKFMV